MSKLIISIGIFMMTTGLSSCDRTGNGKDCQQRSCEGGKLGEDVGLKIWPLSQEDLDKMKGRDIEAIRMTFGGTGEESKFLDETRLSFHASYEQWKSAHDGDLIGVDFYFDDSGKMVRWAGEYFAGTFEDSSE